MGRVRESVAKGGQYRETPLPPDLTRRYGLSLMSDRSRATHRWSMSRRAPSGAGCPPAATASPTRGRSHRPRRTWWATATTGRSLYHTCALRANVETARAGTEMRRDDAERVARQDTRDDTPQ